MQRPFFCNLVTTPVFTPHSPTCQLSPAGTFSSPNNTTDGGSDAKAVANVAPLVSFSDYLIFGAEL